MIYEAHLEELKNTSPHSEPTEVYATTTKPLLNTGDSCSVEQLVTRLANQETTLIVDYGLSQLSIHSRDIQTSPRYEIVIPRISYYKRFITNRSQLTTFLNGLIDVLKNRPLCQRTDIKMDIYYPEVLINHFKAYRNKHSESLSPHTEEVSVL
ncbi:hypothetical protein CI610_01882 [invertebrate metagenome]|uniref:Uncharacterized protein n=1 Tax=invertebrate metagenome TaxID=1711999 RepID=A0A2H9T7E3_9ZZZZ